MTSVINLLIYYRQINWMKVKENTLINNQIDILHLMEFYGFYQHIIALENIQQLIG